MSVTALRVVVVAADNVVVERMTCYSGRIPYTDMYDMLRNMEPPVGFGKKCPYRLAYRVSIMLKISLHSFVMSKQLIHNKHKYMHRLKRKTNKINK